MREVIAVFLLIAGTLVFIVSIIGIHRLKYVMNRMHSASLGDTMGLSLIVMGLMVVGIDVFHIFKYLLIIVFFWLSNPIATSMIAKVETLTNKDYEKRMREK